MRMAPDLCGTCRHWEHQGSNVVPYGSISVVESEVYECGLGHYPGECDEDEDYERGEG